eukprot:CAMPEP_0172684838 /NCGR_PEP_ID=MMETSP1074-20121228/19845_1 /TAXON_ID=2916 /ORGANISM="Ceratium fusus, Strain PA161109" /LENGTH=202 /DNA_ID=CAMNT_0013503913 /DNA_START=123 /DNA_END=731 /DNA_ORIENTATION=-
MVSADAAPIVVRLPHGPGQSGANEAVKVVQVVLAGGSNAVGREHGLSAGLRDGLPVSGHSSRLVYHLTHWFADHMVIAAAAGAAADATTQAAAWAATAATARLVSALQLLTSACARGMGADQQHVTDVGQSTGRHPRAKLEPVQRQVSVIAAPQAANAEAGFFAYFCRDIVLLLFCLHPLMVAMANFVHNSKGASLQVHCSQ